MSLFKQLPLTSILLAFGLSASAGPMSASYEIKWDVLDGGGSTALSSSFTLHDSVAQPGALGMSSSASYRLQPGFLAPPDTDTDTVRDFMDNCSQDANSDQRDSNGDGFGNACDADLNNDNVTNVADLGLLRASFFTSDADADLNGDGIVNVQDLGILRSRFFTAPGPSGLAP
ncbi:MAG: thrombospondin type 3 repeat-containing protein [Gammaproteobacteria bacterium]